jgi:teichuronic acid biosynthesis glycosyltransferase TuaC
VCNRDSEFGRYCFPQKFHESVACGVPVVAAAVGALKGLLASHPRGLYTPDDPASLAQALESQLGDPACAALGAPTWRDAAGRLEELLIAARGTA